MKVLVPARMESSRFPGKALAPIDGVPMVVVCAQNAIRADLDTFVCSDSQLIGDACKAHSIQFIQTPKFKTGTDRIKWASTQMESDLFINLQGDEPLISSAALNEFSIKCREYLIEDDVIVNGLGHLDKNKAFDVNNVKAVTSHDGSILYLSRKALRNSIPDIKYMSLYLKQLGLYGFTRQSLTTYSEFEQSRLERTENIEMLRWLENQKKLVGVKLETASVSVDTPEDMLEVQEILSIV